MSHSNNASPINPVVKQILIGLHDVGSPFSKLNGMWHILDAIWTLVKQEWKRCIKTFPAPIPRYNLAAANVVSRLGFDPREEFEEGAVMNMKFFPSRQHQFEFPDFTGININMMPFILGRPFEHSRLPDNLKPYYENIISNMNVDEQGKIGFLTICETKVEKNTTQRRAGLHTDKGRKVFLTEDDHCCSVEGGDAKMVARFVTWGVGNWLMRSRRIFGGIYIATNRQNSTKVWNCKILDHPDGDEIIGHLGDVSHLRSLLPEGKAIEPNCLYWITDRTPHEALPLEDGGPRQFFRLVTSQVSVWYEEHSTPNPTGLMPDPEVTKVVKGSKFMS